MAKKTDIFEMLIEDHNKTKDLLNELMDGLDSMSDAQIRKKVETLKQDLVLHMDVEEKAVYPELKRLEDLKDEIGDAADEHKELRAALKEFDSRDPDEELLQRIMGMVSHHVTDEEEEVFPVARRVMPGTDYQEMSKEALQVREELQSKSTHS